MNNVASVVAATPQTRDRYADFLRVASLGGVIVGHFLMAAVVVHGAQVNPPYEFTTIQAVEPLTRGATLLFQVVPIFFAVGGFVHARAWRSLRERGGGYGDFVRVRYLRLMRPTFVFLAVWMAVSVSVSTWWGEPQHVGRVFQVVGEPLWFMGIYLLVIACAPVMVRLHERWGVRAFASMVAAIAAVDCARLVFEIPHVMWANVVLVWLTIHQVGFFYADAVADRVGSLRLGGTMLAVGGVATATLIAVGPYGVAMVAYPGEEVSNHIPPTLVLLTFAIAQLGLLLMLRAPLSRWLSRPRPWTAVVAGGAVAMTAYLWHFTALVAMYLALYLLDVPAFPEPASGAWWWWRVPLLVVLTVVTAALVAMFRTWDRGPSRREPVGPSGLRASVAVAGMVCASVGMVGFAAVGFRGVVDGYTSPAVAVPLSAAAAAVLVAASAVLMALSARGQRSERAHT